MKKNDVLNGIADGIGYNGEGILHIDGTTVFVPFCMPGESVKFKVLKADKNIAYGKVESIESPSIYRLNPVCPVV